MIPTILTILLGGAMAYSLGASWIAIAVAALLWIMSALRRGIQGILLCILAPIVLVAFTPTPLLGATVWLETLVLVLVSVVPLVMRLGPDRPTPRHATVAIIPLLLVVVFSLLPPARALANSDLGLGVMIVLLGAGTLVASAWAPAIQIPRRPSSLGPGPLKGDKDRL